MEIVKPDSYVTGNIKFYDTKEKLTELLAKESIGVEIGQWALRLKDYPSVFKIAYIGNITPEEPYEIEGDGYDVPVSEVSDWCKKLSCILKNADINHEIIHLSHDEDELAVFEHKNER